MRLSDWHLAPSAVAHSYNSLYQTIYGPDHVFTIPEALVSYLEPIDITSLQQLETLFILWNTALRRSPLLDVTGYMRSGTFNRRAKNISY